MKRNSGGISRFTSFPRNFSWVIPESLAGCAKPDSEVELRTLVNAGITLLVTLSVENMPHNSIKHMTDLRHEVFPCAEFEGVPLATMLAVLCCIQREIADSGKVAVHCRAGNGRTGTVLAGYVMKMKNISAMDAVRTIRQCRPYSVETRAQEQSVRVLQQHLVEETRI